MQEETVSAEVLPTVTSEGETIIQKETILEGELVYDIMLDTTLRMTNPGKNSTAKPQPYFIASYNGAGFQVKQNFVDAWGAEDSDNQIGRVKLIESKYHPKDPDNAGKFLTSWRRSWTLSSFATRKQITGGATYSKKVQAIRNADVHQVNLDDSKMDAILKLLTAPKAD